MCLGSISSSSLFTEKTGIGFPGHEAIDGGTMVLFLILIVLVQVYLKHA